MKGPKRNKACLECSRQCTLTVVVRLAAGQLPAGDLPVSGKHDTPGAEDPVYRGAVWHAAGLHHPTCPAKDLPGAPIPDQAALPAPAHPRL